MSYTAPALVAAVKCVDCGDGPLYGNALQGLAVRLFAPTLGGAKRRYPLSVSSSKFVASISRKSPPCVVANARHATGHGRAWRLAWQRFRQISFFNGLATQDTRMAQTYWAHGTGRTNGAAALGDLQAPRRRQPVGGVAHGRHQQPPLRRASAGRQHPCHFGGADGLARRPLGQQRQDGLLDVLRVHGSAGREGMGGGAQGRAVGAALAATGALSVAPGALARALLLWALYFFHR